MSVVGEQRWRFDFTRFRFVVTAILLVAAGLKAYQLATVPLPPIVQNSVFTPLLELFNNRYLLMTVVVGEILFALILIADIYRSWMWLLSLLCFSAFTLVSLIKGLSGESSCGCFGTVAINPWITTCFDLAIVTLLTVFRERIDWTLPPLGKKKVSLVLLAWLVLAVPALFAMRSLTQWEHELGMELKGFDGRRMISLDPEKWIGKEFPLLPYFAKPREGDCLKQGNWIVLLIHIDCERCQKMLADLEKRKVERIAIVVVPSQANEKIPNTSFPVFTLDNQMDWFADTPRVVKLSERICVLTGERVEERSAG